MFRPTIILMACAVFALPATADEQSATHEYKLENGLQLIVREDHRAPVVISQIWYRVGSGYEPGGITGISHALEHMMFKGTKLHPAGEFSRIIAQNGGKENAFTSNDYTGYYQELEAKRLPIALSLEADRMQNLTLPESEYKKEIEVVKEERRMRIDDDPQSITYERLHAAAHLSNPYHHLTIGWMNDLNNMKVTDLRTWYHQWYAPNNATLIVIGDVKPDAVYQLVKKSFGAIPTKDLPTIKPQLEPESVGVRHVVVNAKANLPVIFLAYNVPSLLTAKNPSDAYALEVLSGILDAGDSARFSKNLIRQQAVASNASANYDLYSRFSGLFTLDGIPGQNHSIKELEKAFLQQIERLKTDLVDESELSRVKAQMVAAKVYTRDSLDNQAMQIGQLLALGLSWRESDNYLKQVQAITPTQLRDVAKRYLSEKRLTIAELKPIAINSNDKPAELENKGDQNVH